MGERDRKSFVVFHHYHWILLILYWFFLYYRLLFLYINICYLLSSWWFWIDVWQLKGLSFYLSALDLRWLIVVRNFRLARLNDWIFEIVAEPRFFLFNKDYIRVCYRRIGTWSIILRNSLNHWMKRLNEWLRNNLVVTENRIILLLEIQMRRGSHGVDRLSVKIQLISYWDLLSLINRPLWSC